jgi:hypothetical protein
MRTLKGDPAATTLRNNMLSVSRPRRSPLGLKYVYLLDGGIVVRRFWALTADAASRRARRYVSRLAGQSG